ncbi:TauD/TfdA dioxygenase family protein [Erwinia amylovora]|uniref:TauD/TfdA dioxygenase family protein n=1 Tax=Erwinia amylovora TaxID=552 RepID=UPI0014444DE2|nr:TauD/TfdA family dioxygenase [Erwinia amylovora]
MNPADLPDTLDVAPLTGETGEPCSFGILIKPCRAGRHIGELSVTWLRALVYSHQLVVLRGFDHFASSDSLTRYCATFGEIMMWPYGAVLELVEHANPDDHIFANSYVPLHWDGMYLDTVPEFQLFQCVHAVGDMQGGRTTFSSTNAALRIATPAVRELWARAHGRYQRSVELYSNTVEAPIIGIHPLREFPVIRFCEPPDENDATFLNPSSYSFGGINKDEEEMLLVSLMKTLRDPRVYYAHQWQTGDFVLSDNLSLLHGREQYTHHSGRHLRRVHIHGRPQIANHHLVRSE